MTKTKVVRYTRFDPGTAHELARIAQRESATISSVVRRLVATGLEIERRMLTLAIAEGGRDKNA